jgi:hypothetical protein
MIQHWLGFSAPAFPGSRFLPALLGTLVFVYGGSVFLQGAWHELLSRRPGMMTLIALAISVAFVFSAAVTFGYEGMDLWWELATLVTIMILGHWIEMRSIDRAQGALKALACRIQTLDDAGEVRERPGEPVDLVDDDAVNEPVVDGGEQSLQRRTVEGATGEAAVVVGVRQQHPAFGLLALHVGGAGLPLGMERVELLLEPVLGGLPGVDGAADRLHQDRPPRLARPKKRGPDHAVPVIRRATAESER